MTRETFGEFDAVVSLGAFEHFASRQDYDTGRQAEVYRTLLRPHRERAAEWREILLCRR